MNTGFQMTVNCSLKTHSPFSDFSFIATYIYILLAAYTEFDGLPSKYCNIPRPIVIIIIIIMFENH